MQRLALTLLLLSIPATAYAEPHMVLNFERNLPSVHAYGGVKHGWTLTVKVGFAFKGAETDDQLLATVFKGRKKLGKAQCKRDGHNTHYSDLTDKTKDTRVNLSQCRLADKRTANGKMRIVFDYKSSDAEKTFTRVAALYFEVRRGKKYFDAPQDNSVGPVFFRYDPDSMRDKYKKTKPALRFRTRVMVPYSTATPKNTKVRCSLNGTKVFYTNVRAYSKLRIGEQFSTYDIKVAATHRVAPGTEGIDPKSHLTWAFGNSPDHYKCCISIEGTVYRRFSFTVNSDGNIEDRCGPALGMDAAHGIVTSNSAKNDHKHDKKLAAKHLLWLKSVPKACKGLL